jgi:hypothetical protein
MLVGGQHKWAFHLCLRGEGEPPKHTFGVCSGAEGPGILEYGRGGRDQEVVNKTLNLYQFGLVSGKGPGGREDRPSTLDPPPSHPWTHTKSMLGGPPP